MPWKLQPLKRFSVNLNEDHPCSPDFLKLPNLFTGSTDGNLWVNFLSKLVKWNDNAATGLLDIILQEMDPSRKLLLRINNSGEVIIAQLLLEFFLNFVNSK